MKHLSILSLVACLAAACGEGPDSSVNPSDVATISSGAAIGLSIANQLEDEFGNISLNNSNSVCERAIDVVDDKCPPGGSIEVDIPRGQECTAERAEYSTCILNLRDADGCQEVSDCILAAAL